MEESAIREEGHSSLRDQPHVYCFWMLKSIYDNKFHQSRVLEYGNRAVQHSWVIVCLMLNLCINCVHWQRHHLLCCSPHFQLLTPCHLNNALSGAREAFPSVSQLGLSAPAPFVLRSQEAVGHSDHPYFASIVCDSEQRAAIDSALLISENCDPTIAAAKVAALRTASDASYCTSNGSQLTSASATGHRLPQKPAQGPDDFPVISAVCSQSTGRSSKLSISICLAVEFSLTMLVL